MAALLSAVAVWPVQAQQQPGPQGRPGPIPAGQQSMQREAHPPVAIPSNGRPVSNKMTPEERRQLRRDVNQAGHDIYHDRPPKSRR